MLKKAKLYCPEQLIWLLSYYKCVFSCVIGLDRDNFSWGGWMKTLQHAVFFYNQIHV